MNAARSIAENFNELSKEIEVFPQKVATALRVQTQDAGILGNVWSTVKKFATFSSPHVYRYQTLILLFHQAVFESLLG